MSSYLHTEPQKSVRKRGVRFEEEETESERSNLALILTQYILQHFVNRAKLLRKNRGHLKELKDVLRTYLPLIDTHLKQEGNRMLFLEFKYFKNLILILVFIFQTLKHKIKNSCASLICC